LKGGDNNMTKTVLGIFTNKADAEDTIDRLRSEGFNAKDISLVMHNKTQQKEIANNTGANVAGGAITGVATGAVVGGIAGLLAGTTIPVLGGLLLAGPIGAALGLTGAAATTVSGAATGAVAGGLIGALMGIGMTKEDATYYQSRVNEGAILIAVPAADNEEAGIITEIFDDFNASDVKTITQAGNSYIDRNRDRQDIRSDAAADVSRSEARPHFQMGTLGGSSRRDSSE